MNASLRDERFTRSPEMMSAILRFPGERLAAFTCSFGAADAGWYQIVGTKGDLKLDPAYEYAEPIVRRLTRRMHGGRTFEKRFPKRDQFAPELLYFSDCILSGREPEPSGREGLADVRVIRALLESARSGKPVGLRGYERRRRPNLSMEKHRRPAPPPRHLVHAAAPSQT